MLTPLHRQRGVSLIELMIGLAIFAVLLGLGVPNFSKFIQNSHIRNAADAIQNGLSLARAEAVRRNTAIDFVLGTGSSWTIGCTSPIADLDGDGVADCPATIQARPASEGSAKASVATSEVDASTGTVASTPVFTSTLTFNGLGRVLGTTLPAGHDAYFNVSNPTGGSCATAGPMRCLRVDVSSAGAIRMCDPALASTDPQGC